MKNLNKSLMAVLFLSMVTLKANAFIITTLVIVGELIMAEVGTVAVVGEAIATGNTVVAASTASTAIVSQGVRKGVVSLVKASSNYRKTAIENATIKRGGWVKDPYDGKHYRIKDMDADHIWPKSLGGTNHSVNLVMTSKHNNRSKGNIIDFRVIKGYLHKLTN